ncbi:MAG TPA: serine/threonine-protein kinase [Kofleriaceae bacterium]|nr:serine/threonine-protein kinase [Kofleriaceae bacterium]
MRPSPSEPSAITVLEIPTSAVISSRPAPQRALSVGTAERYRLRDTIGRGGMGDILAATDAHFGREVVVKRMRAPSEHDPSMERFFREATIQGRLDHPAVVPVYDIGVDDDGRPFFTMKKLAGITLAERIAERYARQRMLRAFVDVCLAIEFAHARGVIHRDLKPANILLGEFGEVYVLDWGVAKVIGEPENPTLRDGPSLDEPVTLDGVCVGTPGYMSPEQARGLPDVDGRTDVYALGCVLFELLCGQPLHPRERLAGMRSAILGLADARPSARGTAGDIPPELDELCVAATRREREHRIRTARELGERVQRFLDGDRDLALRQELAFGHLIAAQRAFAQGDSAGDRALALREAGRALALDPKLVGAAELVGRLMLEPPRDKPPELASAIAAANLQTLRMQSRSGARGYLAYVGFVPALIASGSHHLGCAIALVALALANAWLLVSRWGFRHLRARLWLTGLGNTALIAVLARTSSPLLVAPGVAAITTMALVFSPMYDRARNAVLLALGMIAAICLPWAGEVLGLWSPTMHVSDHDIVLATKLHLGDPIAEQLVLVGYVALLISGAVGLAWTHRRTERLARERLHLQAYQLRQLVPDVPAASATIASTSRSG